jgi:PAS domain S-box-containing protein
VTERREAAQALRRSEERSRLLVQVSSDMVSVFDAVGTALYQSPSIEWVLGYRPKDRVGKNVFVDPLVHPEDLASKRAFFAKARRSLDAIVTAEFRLRHAEGSWRHIEAVDRNMLQTSSISGGLGRVSMRGRVAAFGRS